MDKILITTGGVILIGFIYWFFFGKKENVVVAQERVEVLVDGGYKPSVIKIKKGSATTLVLTRKDPNSCLEEFILSDFKIKKYLPVGKSVEIVIRPQEAGEYKFHCGMNMFHGKVIVE